MPSHPLLKSWRRLALELHPYLTPADLDQGEEVATAIKYMLPPQTKIETSDANLDRQIAELEAHKRTVQLTNIIITVVNYYGANRKN